MTDIISSRIPIEKYKKLKNILQKLNLTNTMFLNTMIDIFISKYEQKDSVNACLQGVNKKENDDLYLH